MTSESRPWGTTGMEQVSESRWRDKAGKLWMWTQASGWMPA